MRKRLDQSDELRTSDISPPRPLLSSMSGALVGALTRTRKALGIALLALTPSNPTFSSAEAVGMRTETLFQEASKGYGFDTLPRLEHPENFKPGYWFEYGRDVWDAESLCQDCCIGPSLEERLETEDPLAPLQELKRELVSPYLVVKFDDQVITESVTKLTLTLRDFKVKKIEDEAVRQYLTDPVCVRNFTGPKRTWVVTETLEATPVLTLSNLKRETIEIPEGAQVTISRFSGNTVLRITPNEPVVIGFKKDLFPKKALNLREKRNAERGWEERYEHCQKEHKDYCEAVENVEDINAGCHEQLAHHPGFLRVILVPPEDRWVPGDEACAELTWHRASMGDEDLPYPERRRQTVEVKPDQDSRFTRGNARIEVIEGSQGGWGVIEEERSPVSAQITVVAYDDAMRTIQYCLPQETLQREGVRLYRDYEFDKWEEEFQIPIPSGGGWEVKTEVVYLGKRVDGPQIGIQRGGGGPVNLSTPQLQNVDLEIRQETGEHVYTYKVLPPCELEAPPEFPEDCVNCGQLKCPGE